MITQYSITDVVETGHSKYTGSSIDITFTWDGINDISRFRNSNIPKLALKLIDCLDHALITDDERFLQHSYRHFLLEESKDFIQDIHATLFGLINAPEFKELYEAAPDSINIKYGKESYTTLFLNVASQKLIKYAIEG